jgi:hypothetical protein
LLGLGQLARYIRREGGERRRDQECSREEFPYQDFPIRIFLYRDFPIRIFPRRFS